MPSRPTVDTGWNFDAALHQIRFGASDAPLPPSTSELPPREATRRRRRRSRAPSPESPIQTAKAVQPAQNTKITQCDTRIEVFTESPTQITTLNTGLGDFTKSPTQNTKHDPRLGDFTHLFAELGISQLPPKPLVPGSPVDSEGLTSSDDVFRSEQASSSSSPRECGEPDSSLDAAVRKQAKQARKKAAKKARKEKKALEKSGVSKESAPQVQSVERPRAQSNVGVKILKRQSTTPMPDGQAGASKQVPPARILQFPEVQPESAPLNVSAQRQCHPQDQPLAFAYPTHDPFRRYLTSNPSNGLQPAVQNDPHDAKSDHPPPPQSALTKPKVKHGVGNQALHSLYQVMPNGVQPFHHGLIPRTVQPGTFYGAHDVPLARPMMIPSQVSNAPGAQSGNRPDARTALNTVPTGHTPSQTNSFNRSAIPVQQPVTPGRVLINGLEIRPKTARHLHLMNKLLANFPEDANWLVAPMPLRNEETAAQGIHCFVDASNIMFGFRDIVRKYTNHRFEMSFDVLASLMERRRPVAKRIYASSHRESQPVPHVAKLAETSKAVGYENLVKEQVCISRQDSDRKKFFKDVDRHGWHKATALHSGGGSGSDSEMGRAPATPKPPPKWVEQGVDEILHLKMCQSIIDTEVPTTMVLATGDGNAAEFSDGFLANVERALKNGWRVELVSWRQNMSAAYRKPKFRMKWGDKFSIIELDEYLECLIDTA